MKLSILFVVASFALVGATIAIAVPNPVHANPNFDWCQEFSISTCFSNKGDCKKSLEGIAGDPKCVKQFKIH